LRSHKLSIIIFIYQPLTEPDRSRPESPLSRRVALLSAHTAAAALLPTDPVQAADPQVSTLRFGACPESLPRPAAPDRVERGRISFPLDWTPPGPRIEVAVSRVPASGTPAEHRGALLVNPGGPGGSGLP
jgi:hypothetical protein